MAQDIMSKFYTCLTFPIEEKLSEISRIVDVSSTNKDLQTLFPQLISDIFGQSFSDGWGLRTITSEINKREYDLVMGFLEPHGTMFRLCYKLMTDYHLKYNVPISILPVDLQVNLEKGRAPKFYLDMLNIGSDSHSDVTLALNPFDYYILHFALHLLNTNQNKHTWENWNSAYFGLVCDYLVHFLPPDPNMSVLPHILNHTGKVPVVAPLQTVNRPLLPPSLLLLPDFTGVSNQLTGTQSLARNEAWRSETVLQIFVDIWMSIEPENGFDSDLYHSNQLTINSPERVRITRVLVKHLHSFSARFLSDPTMRYYELRKYARQIMCSRSYQYIKHLVQTWPLDASFRLVMEVWLSFIRPWRYTNASINQDRFSVANNNLEDGGNNFDVNYTQFVAENYPSYTCIFQMILPRFTSLDLTTYKNAVMLFRLGKVFSQPQLVPFLRNLEQAIIDNSILIYQNPDLLNSSSNDYGNTINGYLHHKWVSTAKQAISELNLSPGFEYIPIWADNRTRHNEEFLKKILSAKYTADRIYQQHIKNYSQQNKGVWSAISHWLMIGDSFEENIALEESKKIPHFLSCSVDFFSNILGVNEGAFSFTEPDTDDILEQSTCTETNNFTSSISNKLRQSPNEVRYMGDPDLMPITSYESTILVRILYQIAARINEVFEEHFVELWNSNDCKGYVAREVLQKPCVIQSYVKGVTSYQNIVRRNLPPRLSLRRLGSYSFVMWFMVGYGLFRLFSFSGVFYVFTLFILWSIYILVLAGLKRIKS